MVEDDGGILNMKYEVIDGLKVIENNIIRLKNQTAEDLIQLGMN